MSPLRPLSAVVLAAGEGTRMKSDRPKPLHVLCGRPMLVHIIEALHGLSLERCVIVVGHGAEKVTKLLQEQAPQDLVIDFVEQRTQRGTGDAVLAALTAFPDDDFEDGDLLVVPSDVPLIRTATLDGLVAAHRAAEAAATVLSARLDDPDGYSRIVRDKNGRLARIVDDVDCNDEERVITEINSAIYCFRRSLLAPALRRLSPENTLGEYYLSDVPAVLHDAGYLVDAFLGSDPAESRGVNDRVQLAAAEAELRRRTNARWLQEGVTMLDPDRTYIDSTVELGRDVTVFPGTMLQGDTVVGAGARLGPDTRLVDCVVGAGALVEHTAGRDAEIGENAVVGPFAYLTPGSVVASGVRTGPFYTPPVQEPAGD